MEQWIIAGQGESEPLTNLMDQYVVMAYHTSVAADHVLLYFTTGLVFCCQPCGSQTSTVSGINRCTVCHKHVLIHQICQWFTLTLTCNDPLLQIFF